MSENEKFVYTACQGWGCHEHCVLKTYVKDGVIERTERALLKGSLAERPGICQKGILAGRFPYLPERLLYPLKRIGKRGEGKFERISWDQALDEIGDKLNEIIEKYGPRSVITNTFCCGLPTFNTAISNQLSMRFIHAVDCSRIQIPHIDFSTIVSTEVENGTVNHMESNSDTMIDSNYIIIWGGAPVGWTRAAHTSKTIMDAQERGTKVVTVGRVFDCSAAKADQFIPINPGTDAAFALSMAKIIIDEGYVAEEPLLTYTVAPLLVRDDNGQFLRNGDVSAEGDPSDYMYWDKNTKAAVAIKSGQYEFGNGSPELCTQVTVSGIACKTAFLKLKESIAQWTPEAQEKVTGVPAEVAVQLIHEYLNNSPVSIFMNAGMRYANGLQSARAINLLTLLSGNFVKRGGRIFTSPLGDGKLFSLNDLDVMWPDGISNMRGEQPDFVEILKSFDNPDAPQQYKALINPFANPIHCWPSPNVIGEQFLDKLDLVVVFEIRETDTTAWADYVLPECTVFEREELIANNVNCIILQEPAIEPLGESKPPVFIWNEIARRIGISEYFDLEDVEAWSRMRIASGDPALNCPEPLTYDRLKEEKIVKLNLEDDFDLYANGPQQYFTPSGRYEFYSERLVEFGYELAHYVPPRVVQNASDKYPLQFYPGRHRVFMQSQFTEYPELRAIGGDKPTVALNPVTARERGIEEGDLVEVYNERGSVTTIAEITEAFPPGMAHLWYAYPKKDHMGDPPTVLSSTVSTNETYEPFAYHWGLEWTKQNAAVGMPQAALFFGGPNYVETYWDDVCEVRKIKEA